MVRAGEPPVLRPAGRIEHTTAPFTVELQNAAAEEAIDVSTRQARRGRLRTRPQVGGRSAACSSTSLRRASDLSRTMSRWARPRSTTGTGRLGALAVALELRRRGRHPSWAWIRTCFLFADYGELRRFEDSDGGGPRAGRRGLIVDPLPHSTGERPEGRHDARRSGRQLLAVSPFGDPGTSYAGRRPPLMVGPSGGERPLAPEGRWSWQADIVWIDRNPRVTGGKKADGSRTSDPVVACNGHGNGPTIRLVVEHLIDSVLRLSRRAMAGSAGATARAPRACRRGGG